MYEGYDCPGAFQAWACTGITLPPGGKLRADFKILSLIVNSTATTTAADVSGGVCDVPPSSRQQTCTLPQAIDVSNTFGGRTIGCDIPGGGVPVIAPSEPLPIVRAPTVIDVTTQPGGRVELAGSHSDGSSGLNLEQGADGSVVRGMVVHGFSYEITLGSAHDVTLQDDFLGSARRTAG